jgi:hypothetical protein
VEEVALAYIVLAEDDKVRVQVVYGQLPEVAEVDNRQSFQMHGIGEGS